MVGSRQSHMSAARSRPPMHVCVSRSRQQTNMQLRNKWCSGVIYKYCDAWQTLALHAQWLLQQYRAAYQYMLHQAQASHLALLRSMCRHRWDCMVRCRLRCRLTGGGGAAAAGWGRIQSHSSCLHGCSSSRSNSSCVTQVLCYTYKQAVVWSL
jgi:hypothetical protein